MIHESEENAIQSLKDFIKSNPDPTELKRALAAKLASSGWAYRAIIQQSQGVSYGFISKWKTCFQARGILGIRLAYKGRESFFTKKQTSDVIAWIISQEHWDVSELEVYLIEQYDVFFQSPQSYYELFI